MAKKEVGRVKWFNNFRGYGFIIRKSGNYIFMHIDSIISGRVRMPKKNDKVEFDILITHRGEVTRNIKVM
jgi:CspA family cold shock protein